jgi:hypothetical protein
MELEKIIRDKVDTAVKEENRNRYPKRSLRRKNYKELELGDEDQCLCKFLSLLFFKFFTKFAQTIRLF